MKNKNILQLGFRMATPNISEAALFKRLDARWPWLPSADVVQGFLEGCFLWEREGREGGRERGGGEREMRRRKGGRRDCIKMNFPNSWTFWGWMFDGWVW